MGKLVDKAIFARESTEVLCSLGMKEKRINSKENDRNSISMRIPKSSTRYTFDLIVIMSSWESEQSQMFGNEDWFAAERASRRAKACERSG